MGGFFSKAFFNKTRRASTHETRRSRESPVPHDSHRSREPSRSGKTRRAPKRVRIMNSAPRVESIERYPEKAVSNREKNLARRNVIRQMNKYGIPHEIRKEANMLTYVAELEEKERKLDIHHPTETLGKLLTKYGKSGRITLNNVKNVVNRARRDRRLGLQESAKSHNLTTLASAGLYGDSRHAKTRKRHHD